MKIIKINNQVSPRLEKQRYLSGKYFVAEFKSPTFTATIIDPKTRNEIEISPVDYFDRSLSVNKDLNTVVKYENLKEIKELRKCLKVYCTIGISSGHIKERLDLLIKSL